MPNYNDADASYDEEEMRALAGVGPRELRPRWTLSSRTGEPASPDIAAELAADLDDLLPAKPTGYDPPGQPAEGPRHPPATETLVDDFEAAVAECERTLTSASAPSGATPKTPNPKKVPDWVDEAIDAAKPDVPLPLTSLAWAARTKIKGNQKVCRDFAKRVINLKWSPDSIPTDLTSGNSFQSSDIEIQPEGEKLAAPAGGVIYIPELEEVPGTKARTTSKITATAVTSASREGLPRWKDLPASSSRTFETREAVASARLGALSFRGSPTLEDLRSGPVAPWVGLFSIDLTGSRAENFLDGENESTGLGLCRGLLRALKRDTSDRALMVAVWVQLPSPETTAVRLFLALSLADIRPGLAQYQYDMGVRHARSTLKHGGEVSAGGRLKWLQGPAFAKYYDVPVEWGDDWTNPSMLDEMRKRGLEFTDHVWEYTPEDGFPSSEGLDALISKSLGRAETNADLLGMPHWMGSGPMDRLCKSLGVQPKDISMYRGSPDQFAALIMKSGEYMGEYCSTGIKGKVATDAYNLMRGATVDAPI